MLTILFDKIQPLQKYQVLYQRKKAEDLRSSTELLQKLIVDS